MSKIKKERLKKGNLFVPLIFSFGAKIEDLAPEAFLKDPTKISNALRTIQNYFRVDGVVCYGDKTVLAEALGCGLEWNGPAPSIRSLPEAPGELEDRVASLAERGRVGTAIEVTKRLNVLLPDSILMCLLPGPLTLARQLTGFSPTDVFSRPDLMGVATKAILAFSKALGDAGIDMLLFSEEDLPALDEEKLRDLRRCYGPIWNTAKFYEAFPLLMMEHFAMEHAVLLRKIMDGLVYPVDHIPEKLDRASKMSLSFPVSLLESDTEEIESLLSKEHILQALHSRAILLFTTDDEVPATIHKEHMIRGIQAIHEVLKKESSG